MTISELLTIDLNEDIKNVIDLEDKNEAEIQQEIEDYIITEGIAKHLLEFTDRFTSNTKETGVWISGFYGSGKSYFGKMLGYIINNPSINGTPARQRFIPRIKGVNNENFLESNLRSLDAVDTTVVFMDIAKQNTETSLAFTLFANFLKTLGFRNDVFGYIEYELFLEGKYEDFKAKAVALFGKPWDEIKQSHREIAKAMRAIHQAMGFSEAEYNDMKQTYDNAINTFSATTLKNELEKYLKNNSSKTIVFMLDEASEAISQNKFTLLDLEGISEALSSIATKVWTIAIAQEKLDDVINNCNINRNQLIKVTDRFKTKLHLESTEVDVIVKSRLLYKKENQLSKLQDFHQKNDGLISEGTNLKSAFPTKTTDSEEFATYYPFHKYQFNLLQKFLFSSNALVASQIAARGVIFTTFNVLKKHLKNKELYNFSTFYDLCNEAQMNPPTALGIKYDTAKRILQDKSTIDGVNLLKTIHFLNNSADLALATLENITKGYMSDLNSYYTLKPLIEEALTVLVDAKVLLYSNNTYKITSDLESRLLDEMNNYTSELYLKKRDYTSYLKKLSFFNGIASINDEGTTYNFNILTDSDDDIKSSSNKHLKLTVYSPFNMQAKREDFIEEMKRTTQHTKEQITLIPQNNTFEEIDKLIGEIRRYSAMIEKYVTDSDKDIATIIREFSTMKEEKEKYLLSLIETACLEGTVIYLYEDVMVNKESFRSAINEIQKKLIKNIYTRRLSATLSESIIPRLFSESSNDKLHRNFQGEDFKFFDTNGNFIGDSLKVVEEVSAKIKNYTDGRSLEMDLSGAPWGYSFGTIATTLAVLFRAGRLIVRLNATEYFSYQDRASHDAFINTTKFRSASFKAISKTLSAAQKTKLVQTLQELEYEDHTGKKIGYNSSDFDLADAIKILSDYFLTAINTLIESVADFDKLFSTTLEQKSLLQEYTAKTTEANYIDKVTHFIEYQEAFTQAIEHILKTQRFIKNNFSIIKQHRDFLYKLENELSKAHKPNSKISECKEKFEVLFKEDIVKNNAALLSLAQEAKDEYFKLLKNNIETMSSIYTALFLKVESAQKELSAYPQESNRSNQSKLHMITEYVKSKIIRPEDIDLEFDTTCKRCGYSLCDVLNYIDIGPTKESELFILRSNFIQVEPPKTTPIPVNGEPTPPLTTQTMPKEPKKISFKMHKKVMSIREYKELLSQQLRALAGQSDDDTIEITLEH